MSDGQWEQYVEKATDAVIEAQYMPMDQVGRGLIADDIRVALAVVAPLIAEDTRTRMVEAAARAVAAEEGHS